MLTNQIIGAGQNVASHTTRPSTPIEHYVPEPAPEVEKPDALTLFAVEQSSGGQKTLYPPPDRPTLELPKRAELAVAVPDTIPDAEPESIFKAVTTSAKN